MSQLHPEAAVLPSLPPSPSLLDEVFSHPRPWSVRFDDDLDSHIPRPSSGSTSSHVKGKGRLSVVAEDEDSKRRGDTHEAYPPMTDAAAETRRVEETLKRWELAERQRRKSARISVHHASSPSILSSVTRTAGLVLAGRPSIGAASPGSTGAFKSHEVVDVAREGYAVPLDDIDHRASRDVAMHSPSTSPPLFDRGASPASAGASPTPGARASENPFVHPSERSRTPTPTPSLSPSASPSPSPFADAHARQAVPGDVSVRLGRKSTGRSSLLPPPRPLGLPLPAEVPRATQPLPTSRPVLQPPARHPEERHEVRWWHEWLCGCGEGPDRGGDNQAGRTNPFE